MIDKKEKKRKITYLKYKVIFGNYKAILDVERREKNLMPGNLSFKNHASQRIISIVSLTFKTLKLWFGQKLK